LGGFTELKEYGYYKKVPVRDESGRRISHWESVIFECPEEQPEVQKADNENSLFPQKGEVETNAVKSTSSLFPPFVHVENVYIQNEDIQNGQHNNNYMFLVKKCCMAAFTDFCGSAFSFPRNNAEKLWRIFTEAFIGEYGQ